MTCVKFGSAYRRNAPTRLKGLYDTFQVAALEVENANLKASADAEITACQVSSSKMEPYQVMPFCSS